MKIGQVDMENIMSSIVTGIVSSLLVTYILWVKDKKQSKKNPVGKYEVYGIY